MEKSVEINLSSILPEDTSFGKVYFTRSCFSSGRASGNRTIGPIKQNPGGSSIFFAILNLIIKLNFTQKNRAEHGTVISEEKQILLSKRREKISLNLAKQDFILNTR